MEGIRINEDGHKEYSVTRHAHTAECIASDFLGESLICDCGAIIWERWENE